MIKIYPHHNPPPPQEDPRFENSMEGKLFRQCVEALESQDQQAFVDAMVEYNDIKQLDAWFVKFLSLVKEEHFRVVGGGFGGQDAGPVIPDLTDGGAVPSGDPPVPAEGELDLC